VRTKKPYPGPPKLRVLTPDEVAARGLDPIEAMHGHVCGPTCWHTALDPRPGKVSPPHGRSVTSIRSSK